MAQVIDAYGAGSGSVGIEADRVVISHFEETDPDVVGVVGDAEDAEEAVHRCLQVGARATRLVQTRIETEVVERAFERMTKELTDGVEQTASQVREASEALLGEDGGLVGALDGWRQEVTQMLEGAFDEKSKEGILAKFEWIMKDQAERQHRQFLRAIDPGSDESPIGRWKTEIEKTVHREVGEVKDAVVDLNERLAAKDAKAEVLERTAVKGFAFEDLVHDMTCRIVTAQGDTAEKVGRTTGVDGTQKGDEVITLNEADTFGAPERYVLEIKDRRLGLGETWSELDRALSNRQARAAVAVFSSQRAAPSSASFTYSGNRAIVVVDKEDPDERALRLACMWARWLVRRQLGEHTDNIDVARVQSLLDDAKSSLGRRSQVRAAHTAAKRRIDQAASAVDSLVDDLDDLLASIETAVCA